MEAPRVLVVLNTNAAWSRGIARGIMAVAQERGWTLLRYFPDVDLAWLADKWRPAAALIGPEVDAAGLLELGATPLVSVAVDRTAIGIPSVSPDEGALAALAARHLLAIGVKHVSTFRLQAWPFALGRERSFAAHARQGGVRVWPGWGYEGTSSAVAHEDSDAILAWLHALPKPCGVFAGTDAWAAVLARYARVAGLRVPEDVALIGVDNDTLECELTSPSLSSVAVPWRELGEHAARRVQRLLAGKALEPTLDEISPVGVMARRSTDVLAVDDELVAKAVSWIRAQPERRMSVGTVVSAVETGRQRLERGFRRVLDRTIQEEIRRARVEAAKRLLESSNAELREIARQSGFTNATLLNLAFQRELGMAPGAYRRRMRSALASVED